MSAWSALSNAQQIDWVVESVKTNPYAWAATWHEMGHPARDATRRARKESGAAAIVADREDTWEAAAEQTRTAIRDAFGNTTVRDAFGNTLQAGTLVAAWEAAWGASLALIAYDDCDQYLSMTADELRAWALMTEHPAAILLLPMVVVRERVLDLTNNRDPAILCT